MHIEVLLPSREFWVAPMEYILEAYFEANALYPKTNKFVGVSSLKVYRGLPRNAGLPFLVPPMSQLPEGDSQNVLRHCC